MLADGPALAWIVDTELKASGGDSPDGPWLAGQLAQLLREKLGVAGLRFAPEAASRRAWRDAERMTEPTAAALEPLLAFIPAAALACVSFWWQERQLVGHVHLLLGSGDRAELQATRPEGEFLELVDELSRAVLAALELSDAQRRDGLERALRVRPTRSFQAFLAFSRAHRHWQARNLGGAEYAIAEARKLDSGFFAPLRLLATIYREAPDPEREIKTLEAEATLHGEANEPERHAEALTRLGHAYVHYGAWDEALAAYQDAREVWRKLKEPRLEIQARSNRANVFLRQGRLAEAIAEYEAGLAELGEEVSDQGQLLYNLGLALGQVGRYEDGLERLGRALDCARSVHDERLLCRIYNARGAIYDELEGEDLHRALQQYRFAEEYFSEEDDPTLLAGIKDHMAITHRKLGQLEEALKYSAQACELLEAESHIDHRAIAYLNRASLLLELGQVSEAQALAERARSLFESVDSPHLSTAERFLSNFSEPGEEL